MRFACFRMQALRLLIHVRFACFPLRHTTQRTRFAPHHTQCKYYTIHTPQHFTPHLLLIHHHQSPTTTNNDPHTTPPPPLHHRTHPPTHTHHHHTPRTPCTSHARPTQNAHAARARTENDHHVKRFPLFGPRTKVLSLQQRHDVKSEMTQNSRIQ